MRLKRRNATFLYRLLVVCVATIVLLLVLLGDALYTPLLHVRLIRLGFDTFVAVMFLALGTLVWLYARDRITARLMYGVTCAVMLTFALETATAAGNLFAQAISGACSSLALLLFALLLLHFPQDVFATFSQNQVLTGRGVIHMRLLRGYLFIAGLFCMLAMTFAGVYAFATPPTWLEICYRLYNVVILAGIVGTMAISYRSTPSVRERQQRRFFVWGVVLSLSPLLVLTVIPEALQSVLPVTPVDGQLSAVSIVLLPIAFGYSILRYQLMVLDTYVRRVVMSVSGVVCLAVLVYVAQSTLNALVSAHSSSLVVLVTLSLLVGLAPCLWYVAKAGTERLFFDEVCHYRRFFSAPTTAGEHALSLDAVARLLIAAARQTFETPDVCLFILNEKGDMYHVSPSSNSDAAEEEGQRFVHAIISLLSPATSAAGLLDRERYSHIFERIAVAQRPLLLSELLAGEQQREPGLMRYLNRRQQEGMDTLFAPIKSQGVVIGILVLGPRGDQRLYAGPDFAIIEALLGRFSPFLETARVTLSLKTTNEQLGEANTQLRDAYEQLQALDRLKDEFITIASHELRTPLTAVQGYISLLRDYNGKDELLTAAMRAEFLAKADLGCEELTLLLGNMTTAGDIEMVAQRVTPTDVSLRKVTLNVAEMFDSLLQQQQRTIEINVLDEFSVRADAQALAQVIRNLIMNAMKYSPERTPIQVSAALQGEQVALSVQDYGKGIPPADQSRLFQRFVRLERDMNSPTRGSGLGLYISKQLIAAMHGRIWVESSGIEGQGSTFILTLPIAAHVAKQSLLVIH